METISFPGKDTTVLTCTFLVKENVGGIRQSPWEDIRPLERMYGKPNKNLVNTLTLRGRLARTRTKWKAILLSNIPWLKRVVLNRCYAGIPTNVNSNTLKIP